jgi:UDP-2,3-diacylglucosamine pyrophosphatase LpxH
MTSRAAIGLGALLCLLVPITAHGGWFERSFFSARDEARRIRARIPGLDKVLRGQAADPHLAEVLKHSQTNGHYYIASDMHFGLGKVRQGAAFDRQEDMTRPEVLERHLAYIARQPGNNTFAVGGDFLDILEHVDPEADLAHLKGTVSAIVKGHSREFQAFAKAVVKDNIRLLFIRGNHDVRLVDSTELVERGTTVREYFLDEIAKVAGLDDAERALWHARVGYAGHMAPLGRYGELLVYHGEERDPSNNWRNPANPYSYTADGRRVIPRNLGDNVVRTEWVRVEAHKPEADNLGSSGRALAAELLHNAWSRVLAIKVLWNATKKRIGAGPAQALAERLDDRRTILAWVEQSGFAEMMNMPLDPAAPWRNHSATYYAALLQRIYRGLPRPVHERMGSRLHLLNLASMIFGGGRQVLADGRAAEPLLLQRLTAALPNVRWVVSGHDHQERVREGEMDKGNVGFIDSGTWTRVNGEDRMNVVVAHTDANGRIVDNPELFRVNPATGVPEDSARAFEETDHVANWRKPTRR